MTSSSISGERLLRVQCKWATKHAAVVLVRCRRCRRTDETGFCTAAMNNTRSMGWRPTVRSSTAASSFRRPDSQGRSAIHLRLGSSSKQPESAGQLGRRFQASSLYNRRCSWGRSSAGRAPEWHSGGRGSIPARLHSETRHVGGSRRSLRGLRGAGCYGGASDRAPQGALGTGFEASGAAPGAFFRAGTVLDRRREGNAHACIHDSSQCPDGRGRPDRPRRATSRARERRLRGVCRHR